MLNGRIWICVRNFFLGELAKNHTRTLIDYFKKIIIFSDINSYLLITSGAKWSSFIVWCIKYSFWWEIQFLIFFFENKHGAMTGHRMLPKIQFFVGFCQSEILLLKFMRNYTIILLKNTSDAPKHRTHPNVAALKCHHTETEG